MSENNLLKTLAEQVAQEREAMLKIQHIIKEAREKARKEAGEESASIVIEQRLGEVKEQPGGEFSMAVIEKSAAPAVQHRLPGRADRIKVFIVEEQVLFSQALRPCLSQTPDIQVVGESEDFVEDTVLTIEELAADVVLVDINLPSLSGLDLARRIIERSPGISVILLTPYEDNELILEALKAGVAGYLSNDITAEGVTNTIRKVFKGCHTINNLLIRPGVARRVLEHVQSTGKVKTLTDSLSLLETEILGCFAGGYSSKEVAYKLAISEESIVNHMACVVSKLITNQPI